mgnify:CR=1 FL=1
MSGNVTQNTTKTPGSYSRVMLKISGEALMGEGPFTVFAPTDAAFAALPDGALEEALMPENRDKLVQILGCHVVETRALAADVAQMIADDGGSQRPDHPTRTRARHFGRRDGRRHPARLIGSRRTPGVRAPRRASAPCPR